jgi:hypothetical protein
VREESDSPRFCSLQCLRRMPRWNSGIIRDGGWVLWPAAEIERHIVPRHSIVLKYWNTRSMWQTFWPDVLVAVIGAVLTVAIAYLTYLLSVRRTEKQALNSLINEFHHRRAISPRTALGPVERAAEKDDFLRANLSVLNMRDEIRRTRDAVRSIADLHDPLSQMTRACNNYLETSAREPDRYLYLLDDLRKELSSSLHRLAVTRRGVRVYEPGQGAF